MIWKIYQSQQFFFSSFSNTQKTRDGFILCKRQKTMKWRRSRKKQIKLKCLKHFRNKVFFLQHKREEKKFYMSFYLLYVSVLVWCFIDQGNERKKRIAFMFTIDIVAFYGNVFMEYIRIFGGLPHFVRILIWCVCFSFHFHFNHIFCHI